MISARAVLTIIEPGRIRSSCRDVMMPAVPSSSGRCRLMISDCANTSSISSMRVMSNPSMPCTWLFHTSVFMPKPLAMRATVRPMPAESDQTELLAVQPDAVDAAPVAATHLRVKPADLSGELHDQGECVLGYGMVAVMHDVAHADATLARDGKIDVAGDAGAAERKARDMAPNGHRVQYVIGDVEADDDDGFGILGAFEDGVGVQREIACMRMRAISCSRGKLAANGSIIDSTITGITMSGRSRALRLGFDDVSFVHTETLGRAVPGMRRRGRGEWAVNNPRHAEIQ